MQRKSESLSGLVRPRTFATLFALIGCLFCSSTHAADRKEVVQPIWDVSGDHLEWLVASPSNASLAVAVRSADVSVYRDKVKVGSYESALNPLFSKNSRSFAFLANDGEKVFFVVDRHALPPLNVRRESTTNQQYLSMLMGSSTAYNSDGTALAYRDAVGNPTSSADNAHVFQMNQAIFVNGKPENIHSEVGPPLFNTATNELAYWARDSGIKQAYIVRHGSAQANRYTTILDPVLFSADGSTFAFIAQTDAAKFAVVVNGAEKLVVSDMPSALTLSPDGKRFGFITTAAATSQQHAVIDGTPGPAFNHVDPVVFNTDGSKCGYAASASSSDGSGTPDAVVIVDGKEVVRQHDARIFGPFFGPNRALAYITQAGARYNVTINATKQGPFAYAGFPVFSETGKHVAYSGIDGISHKVKMIVDGESSSSYEAVTTPCFRGDDKLEYYAVKAGEKFSVVLITVSF